MKRVTLLLILVFFIISYKFFQKFNKEEHEDLMELLKSFSYIECPAGISLYRLQTPLYVYKIQIQSKLPHKPDQQEKLLKRCEMQTIPNDLTRVEYSTNGEGVTALDVFDKLQKPDEFKLQTVDAMSSYLLDESCDAAEYNSEEMTSQRNQRLQLYNTIASNAFLSYMLQVVKGPQPLILSDYKTESDTWSFYTLARGIFPGTLWCGFGNMAEDVYGQVGDHSETDLCCRTHDLCKPMVKAFQTRYFYANPGILPISHCGCDMQFYNCLLRVNSPTSRMIGKIFFNLVKMKCFDFDVREVCTSSILGLCRETQHKCVAVVKSNKLFPE